MKTFKGIVTLALMNLALSSYAQMKDVEVKVLPTKEKGFIKVLFVTDKTSDVQIKFYNEQGLYTVDRVDKNSYTNGFLKKYDIRKIHKGESFWIEVSLKDVVATYKMSESNDRTAYEPQLERYVFNRGLIASKD